MQNAELLLPQGGLTRAHFLALVETARKLCCRDDSPLAQKWAIKSFITSSALLAAISVIC